MQAVLDDGAQVVLPEIIDYETRRALLRLRSASSVEDLDALTRTLRYKPLTTEIMRLAATLWADVRNAGLRTSSDERIDIDAILAAQAVSLSRDGDRVIIATTNVRHLSWFAGVTAEHWQSVQP